MAELLRDHLVEILQRMSAAPRVCLLLDYDGTLAPIVATPDLAVPLPGTAEVLSRIAQKTGVSIVIVNRAGHEVRSLRSRVRAGERSFEDDWRAWVT